MFGLADIVREEGGGLNEPVTENEFN